MKAQGDSVTHFLRFLVGSLRVDGSEDIVLTEWTGYIRVEDVVDWCAAKFVSLL